jgi:hypothetical protein
MPNRERFATRAHDVRCEGMRWLSRNRYLLLNGFVLVPLGLYMMVMWLAFASGFAREKNPLAIIIPPLLALHIIVFLVCWLFAIRRFRKLGNYGQWDLIPIWYFCLATLIMFLV